VQLASFSLDCCVGALFLVGMGVDAGGVRDGAAVHGADAKRLASQAQARIYPIADEKTAEGARSIQLGISLAGFVFAGWHCRAKTCGRICLHFP